MPEKETYRWSFQLSEKTWSIGGMPCPDCVVENNYEAWNRYLSNQISKLLSADTMQTKEFQEELETVRRDMEERLAHQKKLDEAAEVRKRRICMERPKIDYVPKGLYIGIVQPFWQRMLEENKNIEQLLATGEYQTAALMFLQLTKSMCLHFVIDRHWEYFDDMTIQNMR